MNLRLSSNAAVPGTSIAGVMTRIRSPTMNAPLQPTRLGKAIKAKVKGTFCYFKKCFGAVEDPV